MMEYLSYAELAGVVANCPAAKTTRKSSASEAEAEAYLDNEMSLSKSDVLIDDPSPECARLLAQREALRRSERIAKSIGYASY